MKEKKIISAVFFISLLVIVGSVVIALSSRCSFPDGSTYYCGTDFQVQKIQPIFLSFASLFLITLALFFVRREVFLLWAKFAGVAFPLMLGVLLYTYNNKDYTSGFNPMGAITDDYLATIFLPPLFVIISLLIIAVKSWKLRNR